jgi:hypothetical protein
VPNGKPCLMRKNNRSLTVQSTHGNYFKL